MLRYLEIQVSNIMTVQMLDSEKNLFDEEWGFFLGQSFSLSNKIKQFSPSQPRKWKVDSLLVSRLTIQSDKRA